MSGGSLIFHRVSAANPQQPKPGSTRTRRTPTWTRIRPTRTPAETLLIRTRRLTRTRRGRSRSGSREQPLNGMQAMLSSLIDTHMVDLPEPLHADTGEIKRRQFASDEAASR